MRLNTIKPAEGSKKTGKRVGRGIGSGLGKTCGRGHKGQHARAGGFHKVGFEGGQMPIYRRLPKVGFRSKISPKVAEIRLNEIQGMESVDIDLAALKQANILRHDIMHAKVILSGEITKAVTVRGLGVTKGARAAIEAAGGKVEE